MALNAIAEPVVAGSHASLRRLDWDTEFFDALMGSVEFRSDATDLPAEDLADELRELVIDARAQGFRHLILRAANEQASLTWAAEAAGFGLVDVGLDLRSMLAERQDAPCVPVRTWQAADLPALREMAANSFVFSRFAVDPFFSREEVAAFHETWVTNLCNGLAKEVLVTGEVGRPTGFVSCAISGDAGRIPLIAVHASGRRGGVGGALVSAAHDWFRSAGCQEAWVKTQAHNYPALALYQRYGFAIARVDLALSITLGSKRRGE